MIKQTDNVRITDRCYKPTYYPWDEDRRTVHPTCEYLDKGKCTLTSCVRRGYESRQEHRKEG